MPIKQVKICLSNKVIVAKLDEKLFPFGIRWLIPLHRCNADELKNAYALIKGKKYMLLTSKVGGRYEGYNQISPHTHWGIAFY